MHCKPVDLNFITLEDLIVNLPGLLGPVNSDAQGGEG